MMSVGITVKDKAEFVCRAIESALSQGCQVLVSDNASTDDSPALIAGYGDDVTAFLHDDGTANAVRGLNECMDAASGDLFLALDGDDWLAPGAARAFERAEGDWIVADLNLWDDAEHYLTRWCYRDFPRERETALDYLYKNRQLPVSMKGAFRLDWIRAHSLEWRELPSTTASYDVATCLKWLEASPRITYLEVPLVNYRYGGEVTQAERDGMLRDMDSYLKGEW